MREIDLRSDTVTHPTPSMLCAMTTAELGDDVFREDPTVVALERLAAELLDKEAALFVASGTMGNLVSMMAHTHPGDELILERRSHIAIGEGGGVTRIAGLLPRVYDAPSGVVPVDEIRDLIRSSGGNYEGHTTLICIENTHNAHGGGPISAAQTGRLASLAAEYGLALHIDGARLFNAAEVLGVEAAELVAAADSVMFCLSKGLCAPVGSIVAGTADFVDRARKVRRLLGGGMRQAGVLAAAGIVALKEMISRVSEDRIVAEQLAVGLKSVRGICVEAVPKRTNMVYVDCEGLSCTADRLACLLAERGVRLLAVGIHRLRMVTHHGVSIADAHRVRQAFEDAAQTLQSDAPAT